MRAASSLSNRIFLACTLLATSSLGLVFWFVIASVTNEAEVDLRRGLENAASLVDTHRTTLTDTFTRLARLMADLPKLKAAVETRDPPTVREEVAGYRTQMGADLLVISGPDGTVLGSTGAEGVVLPITGERPDPGNEWTLFLPHSRGLLQVVSVPIVLGVRPTELLGRLTVGFFLDHDRAMEFARLTESQVVFGAGNRVLSSSFAPGFHDALGSSLTAREIRSVWLGESEYLALASPIPSGSSATASEDRPVVVVLRSRTDRLAILSTLQAGLAGVLLVAVLLATILSYVVARTITRPLAAVTGAMRDVAATGDLTRRVPVRSRVWDDEDARLLAGAFNTLTESIARFRREESQKERLSSLGRLSTVVAHEIRNPLMIIRASLRTLRHEEATPAERREAVADIDEETARLNRIVTEVLDFAKPLRFDLGEANINEVCKASAAAACAGDAGEGLALDLDPSLPPVVTDAERLRTALVNILVNARQAVQAAEAGNGHRGTPGVVLRTRGDGGRVVVTVRDWGIGIASEDVPHVFDPYFTTRRAGTGLGLPISRNIIEGLGGSVGVSSRQGEGTEIRIELPVKTS
jgi:signal transduction histidine kinase